MMKYALIHGERICEIRGDATSRFPVAPELKWVEVSDDVTTRDQFVGGKVVKFVPPADAPAKPKSERLAAMLAANGLTLADLRTELGK